jgi:hypothetical protein
MTSDPRKSDLTKLPDSPILSNVGGSSDSAGLVTQLGGEVEPDSGTLTGAPRPQENMYWLPVQSRRLPRN